MDYRGRFTLANTIAIVGCTGQACRAIELSLDEMAKDLYTISEPRWVADDYSRTLRNMRCRVHDLYGKYHGLRSSRTQ